MNIKIQEKAVLKENKKGKNDKKDREGGENKKSRKNKKLIVPKEGGETEIINLKKLNILARNAPKSEL